MITRLTKGGLSEKGYHSKLIENTLTLFEKTIKHQFSEEKISEQSKTRKVRKFIVYQFVKILQ